MALALARVVERIKALCNHRVSRVDATGPHVLPLAPAAAAAAESSPPGRSFPGTACSAAWPLCPRRAGTLAAPCWLQHLHTSDAAGPRQLSKAAQRICRMRDVAQGAAEPLSVPPARLHFTAFDAARLPTSSTSPRPRQGARDSYRVGLALEIKRQHVINVVSPEA